MPLLDLSNKIWITRKCRIKFAERLKSNNFWSQFLITWYSFLLIVFSIFDKDPNNTSLTLVLSIGILTFSIIVMSMGYADKALKTQTLYTQLDYLYEQVNSAQSTQYESLYKQYTDLINLTENHSDFDYLSVRYDLRNIDKGKYPNPAAPDKTEYAQYWFQVISTLGLKNIFFWAPFILLFTK